MTISFNTGATGSASTASSMTLAIPGGVLSNDVMVLILEAFTETSSAPTISFSGAGGSWTLATASSGANPEVATAGSSIWSYGYVYTRTATAGDIGATLTISESGSPAGTTWLTAAMGSYTGASTGSPVDVLAGANAQGTTSTTGPSATTGQSGDWAVFMAGAAINSGNPGYSTGTLRERLTSGALVAAALYDSNGSVGSSGTSIGGGTWSQSGNASNWWSTFVLGLHDGGGGTNHNATASKTVTPTFKTGKSAGLVVAKTVVPGFANTKAATDLGKLTVTPRFSVTGAHNYGKGGTADRHHRAGGHGR